VPDSNLAIRTSPGRDAALEAVAAAHERGLSDAACRSEPRSPTGEPVTG
jgi:hypothetical protein